MAAEQSTLAVKLHPRIRCSRRPSAYIEMPDENTVMTANASALSARVFSSKRSLRYSGTLAFREGDRQDQGAGRPVGQTLPEIWCQSWLSRVCAGVAVPLLSSGYIETGGPMADELNRRDFLKAAAIAAGGGRIGGPGSKEKEENSRH